MKFLEMSFHTVCNVVRILLANLIIIILGKGYPGCIFLQDLTMTNRCQRLSLILPKALRAPLWQKCLEISGNFSLIMAYGEEKGSSLSQ